MKTALSYPQLNTIKALTNYPDFVAMSTFIYTTFVLREYYRTLMRKKNEILI